MNTREFQQAVKRNPPPMVLHAEMADFDRRWLDGALGLMVACCSVVGMRGGSFSTLMVCAGGKHLQLVGRWIEKREVISVAEFLRTLAQVRTGVEGIATSTIVPSAPQLDAQLGVVMEHVAHLFNLWGLEMRDEWGPDLGGLERVCSMSVKGGSA